MNETNKEQVLLGIPLGSSEPTEFAVQLRTKKDKTQVAVPVPTGISLIEDVAAFLGLVRDGHVAAGMEAQAAEGVVVQWATRTMVWPVCRDAATTSGVQVVLPDGSPSVDVAKFAAAVLTETLPASREAMGKKAEITEELQALTEECNKLLLSIVGEGRQPKPDEQARITQLLQQTSELQTKLAKIQEIQEKAAKTREESKRAKLQAAAEAAAAAKATKAA